MHSRLRKRIQSFFRPRAAGGRLQLKDKAIFAGATERDSSFRINAGDRVYRGSEGFFSRIPATKDAVAAISHSMRHIWIA